jgi:hypothetical protein
VSRILLLVAVVAFVLVAIGELAEIKELTNIGLLPGGLAFFAGSFLVGGGE